MVIALIVFVLMAIGGVASYYGRQYKNNMGSNIGEKHLREQWGIEERKEYHE